MKTFDEKNVNQESIKKLFDCENVEDDAEREIMDLKDAVVDAVNNVKNKSIDFVNKAMNDEKLQQKIGQITLGVVATLLTCRLFKRIF